MVSMRWQDDSADRLRRVGRVGAALVLVGATAGLVVADLRHRPDPGIRFSGAPDPTDPFDAPSTSDAVDPSVATAACQAAIASGDRFGVLAVSAYQTRPSADVAIVFTHGIAFTRRCTSMNSSRLVAASIPRNCSSTPVSSMLASR